MNAPAIINHSEFKRLFSKKPKFVRVYRDNNFVPHHKFKRVDEPYLIEMLMTQFELSITNAIKISKTLSLVSQKDAEGNRFAAHTGGTFAQLREELQQQFFEKFTYKAKNGADAIGYRVKSDDDVAAAISAFVDVFKCRPRGTGKGKKPLSKLLQIKIEDYKQMHLYTQLQLLKSLTFAKDEMMYFELRHSQEIGNCGRRYNIVNEMQRIDRKKISNLYGVDMETALQRIVYQDVMRLTKYVKLPITNKLIKHKQQVREAVKKLMNYKSIDTAKMEITAIYQGRWYHGGYKKLKKLFTERDAISKVIIKQAFRDSESERVRYAEARSNQKMKDKFDVDVTSADYNESMSDDAKTNYRNSFMFFYWTYIEREVQNIIAYHFEFPITLHDAVYTQNIQEWQKLDIDALEEEIYQKTGYRIPLKQE